MKTRKLTGLISALNSYLSCIDRDTEKFRDAILLYGDSITRELHRQTKTADKALCEKLLRIETDIQTVREHLCAGNTKPEPTVEEIRATAVKIIQEHY